MGIFAFALVQTLLLSKFGHTLNRPSTKRSTNIGNPKWYSPIIRLIHSSMTNQFKLHVFSLFFLSSIFFIGPLRMLNIKMESFKFSAPILLCRCKFATICRYALVGWLRRRWSKHELNQTLRYSRLLAAWAKNIYF